MHTLIKAKSRNRQCRALYEGERKNTTLEAKENWKYLYEESKRDRQKALKRLREAQIQVKEVEKQMKRMAVSFKVELDQEREKAEESDEANGELHCLTSEMDENGRKESSYDEAVEEPY